MKVLCIDRWIAERIKVKPITNAGLDKIQREYDELKKLSFTKDCMTCGTIVMFRNDTLAVYLDGKIAQKLQAFFRFFCSYKFFLSINEMSRQAYLDMDGLGDNLLYSHGSSLDIVRVYEKPLVEQEIMTLKNDNFYTVLEDFAKSRKYIERN